MAQSIPPVEDTTSSDRSSAVQQQIFQDNRIHHVTFKNFGDRRIGWAIKLTNMMQARVDPPHGVLDPRETALITVSCDSFVFGPEEATNDRIIVEWTNTPDGADKKFRREWFQGDGMVRRKNLIIGCTR